MNINWLSYYMQFDGYGRFSSYFVKALRNLGVKVKSATMDHIYMSKTMQMEDGFNTDNLTISCLPPYYLKDVSGRHWLFSMTEGSEIPASWTDTVNNSNVERVIVPCSHNALAFINSGVEKPVYVVPGGTDPEDFPVIPFKYSMNKHYTFLTIADRGFRKGWEETRDAFYSAFGGRDTGRQDVRLIIKCRPRSDNYIQMMANAKGADKRIIYQEYDAPNMYGIYSQADCVVIPSRSEGWGMPHREAACIGLPVITQQYSGLDDGSTQEWALTLAEGRLRPIPVELNNLSLGEWMIPNHSSLVEKMLWCEQHPLDARAFGHKAAQWIRENQTWEHAAKELLGII